jgi:hypothetical protein
MRFINEIMRHINDRVSLLCASDSSIEKRTPVNIAYTHDTRANIADDIIPEITSSATKKNTVSAPASVHNPSAHHRIHGHGNSKLSSGSRHTNQRYITVMNPKYISMVMNSIVIPQHWLVFRSSHQWFHDSHQVQHTGSKAS